MGVLCYYGFKKIHMEKINIESNNEEKSILIGRHFEDVDDLRNGLDTDLKPLSEESIKIIGLNADSVIENTLFKGLEKVIIISSPRKRSRLTADLLKSAIKERREDFLVKVKEDDRFTELAHGEIILPEDYTPGRRVEFLKHAWRIFWKETFTSDSDYNNPNYKFGDSLKDSDGNSKYPEIEESFASIGESYRELSERYYQAIVEYLENRGSVESRGFNVVLIAHSATLGILTELKSVSEDLAIGKIEIKTGDLMKTCWKSYLNRIKGGYAEPGFGEMEQFSLDDINENLLDFLKRELDFVKKPKNYEKTN